MADIVPPPPPPHYYRAPEEICDDESSSSSEGGENDNSFCYAVLVFFAFFIGVIIFKIVFGCDSNAIRTELNKMNGFISPEFSRKVI